MCGNAQLYRDRANCKNSLDVLTNQWGWKGFTIQELKPTSLVARENALTYKRWSVFMRAARPGERLEAINSHPMILTAVCRKTVHAGQSHVLFKCMHLANAPASEQVNNVHALLKRLKATTAQLRPSQRNRASDSRPESQTNQLACAGF